MTSFFAGDAPIASFEFDLPAEADDLPVESVALDVAGATVPATHDGDLVEGSWKTLELPEVGAYPIYLAVTALTRVQRFLVDTLVVVDPDDQWFNVATARADWEGAPDSDGMLHRLLANAREQVEAYAPALAADAPVPERYRAGQLMQARNTYNASLTNGDQQVDAGGFVVTIRPLDWAVKQLLRPKTATKAIF